MNPVITIEPYESFHSELLYPKYQKGLIATNILPVGLSLTNFIIMMGILRTQTEIIYVSCNGEVVALFEKRKTIDGTEVHACWFTTNKKKRYMTAIEVVKVIPGVNLYCPKNSDANGFFAMARRGFLKYQGEKLNMHLFHVA